MKDWMYVICFYWEGDRWAQEQHKTSDPSYDRHLQRIGTVDRELASRYVNNLYRGVERFATREFKFICFTNVQLPEIHQDVQVRPFPMISDRGVLPRVYMFSQEAGLENKQVLCLDLDVVITGSLEPIMNYNGLFCTRAKFKPGEEHKIDGDIMSFRAGKEIDKLLWKPFVNDPEAAEQRTKGRERYWVRACVGGMADLWQKRSPGAVVSYKWHVKRRKSPPQGAAIVSCHGHPRPHQIKDNWIKQYWQ